MEVNTNPHSVEAGMKHLVRLREENFQGYLPTCIEGILKAVDQGSYSFKQLGVTEVEVLDMAIEHINRELLSGVRYPFAISRLKSELACRKQARLGAHRPPDYAHIPTKVTSLPLREASFSQAA
jgi:hypothetical protein